MSIVVDPRLREDDIKFVSFPCKMGTYNCLYCSPSLSGLVGCSLFLLSCLIMYDKHSNFHILSIMNTVPLSSPLTLYTGIHTDNLFAHLEAVIQDFS